MTGATEGVRVVDLSPADVLPEAGEVLEAQGVPPGSEVSDAVALLVAEATGHFTQVAHPAALLVPTAKAPFREVFQGEGENAEDAVVAQLYPLAHRLALFALTLGEGVTTRVAELFEKDDFALAAMLDSVAAAAADRAVQVCEARWQSELSAEGLAEPDHRALAYSPGYCGWHITGQIKLLEAAGAHRIGITLEESCLMTPLKSVTGVLLSGPADLHRFDPDFSFCRWCRDSTCLTRMRRLDDPTTPSEAP